MFEIETYFGFVFIHVVKIDLIFSRGRIKLRLFWILRVFIFAGFTLKKKPLRFFLFWLADERI